MIKKEIKTVENTVENVYCDICEELIGERSYSGDGYIVYGVDERKHDGVFGKNLHEDCLKKVCA